MADAGDSGGLQIIFAIFLGLMVTAFVGVGLHTYYPSPETQSNREIRDLRRQEQAVVNSKAPADLTPGERARIQAVREQILKTEDELRARMAPWGRTVSSALIVFATLSMVISLVRADQLPVLSNGLLLGGVFTMVYGVGLIIATGTSVARFTVMTVALAITLVLGYARFVRRRLRTVPPGGAVLGGEELIAIEQRMAALEKRMDDAASALGHKA